MGWSFLILKYLQILKHVYGGGEQDEKNADEAFGSSPLLGLA